MQWIFSDGLASVSLFLEAYDRAAPAAGSGCSQLGATHTHDARRRQAGDWWLTAVGEVPPQTLEAFAHSLERRVEAPSGHRA